MEKQKALIQKPLSANDYQVILKNLILAQPLSPKNAKRHVKHMTIF